jgi:ABC-type dipeptide/oligopeptide/nickel transport system permease component
MGKYVAWRLVQTIPILLGTTFLIYVTVYALPGDPIQALAGPTNPISPETAAALRAKYHLDDPLLVQYANYLWGLLQGDFGVDFAGNPVSSIIASSWPVTLKLGLTAWAIESVLGVALGTVAALRRGKSFDLGVLTTTTIVYGVPYFVIAYVSQIAFGVKLHWFPVSGVDEGWPRAYILPAVVLALFGLASVARLTRGSVLENLRADHVDTAIAKGLPRRLVVTRHVLRNSMIPVVSLLGLGLGGLLGATVLIEGIFNLPGIGYQIFVGIQQHNGPVVVGIGTMIVLIYIVINLAVDIAYAVLDPRIRYD